MSQTNINNNFFDGVYKQVWRQLIPNGLTEAETDFIEDVAELAPGASVLDLMCGYGRHTLELGRRGYTVTAVDNQAEYIDEIHTHAVASVHAIHQSVLEFQPQGSYDAAVCMGNSFAFFTEEQALEILQRLSAHLKPGGVFIINTWMLGEIVLRHFRDKEWFYAGNYKYLVENSYHFSPSRMESQHIIIAPDGSSETIDAIDYILTVSEHEKLFQRAGFRLRSVFSTPRKRPFVFGDTRAYIVAEKV